MKGGEIRYKYSSPSLSHQSHDDASNGAAGATGLVVVVDGVAIPGDHDDAGN